MEGTKNTTLSEQFQNPIEKLQNEVKSISLTHISGENVLRKT
jgi:flagellin-like hook-associated protein FlgL